MTDPNHLSAASTDAADVGYEYPNNPKWLVAAGNFLFRSRDVVFPIVLIGLLLATDSEIPANDRQLGHLLDGIGLGLAILGQALRCLVVGYRYIVRGGKDKKVYAEGLVTSGVFEISRNPLYVGNLMILSGLMILWNSPLMYVVGVPFFFLGYRAIVAAEETYLGEKYPAEFAEYCARVPRWALALGRLPSAISGLRFNWRRVILKEYGSAAYWIAGATLLLMVKGREYARLARTVSNDVPYWIVIGAVALLWAYARYLKKSKRLREA